MDYGDMNWLAIVCAGLAYWLLGAVWYSALFSKAWRSAAEQHGVRSTKARRGRCPRKRDILPLRQRQLQFSEQTVELELSRGHLNLSVFVARP